MEKNDPLVLGRVVGDVLNPFKRSVDLDVFFKLRKVNNGSEYKPSDIVSKPRVRIGGDDWSKFYTLVSNLIKQTGQIDLYHMLCIN